MLSYQQVDSAADVKIPTPPTYTGYTFVGWSYTPTQIHSSTGSLTVQALYRAGGAKQLTITAPGCTLQCGSQTARDRSDCCLWGAGLLCLRQTPRAFQPMGGCWVMAAGIASMRLPIWRWRERTDDLTPVPSVSLLSAQLQSDTGRVIVLPPPGPWPGRGTDW